jgi:glutamyl aminopeptidase
MPKELTADFTTARELAEVEAFFAANPAAGAGTRARKQALEQIRNNMKWLANHEAVLQDWLLAWSRSTLV